MARRGPSKRHRRASVNLESIKKAIRLGYSRVSPVLAALSFLLGRTVLSDALAPFAPAVYGGLVSLGGPLQAFYGVFAMLGSASLRRWDIFAYHLFAFAVVTILSLFRHGRRNLVLVDALVVGAVVAISREIAFAVKGHVPYSYLFSFLEGLAAATVSLLVSIAFGKDRALGDRENAASAEAALVVGLLALGGLSGLSIAGVRLQFVAVMACVLLVSHVFGAGVGAIAGFAGGLVTSLTGTGDLGSLGAMGAAGLLAGIAGRFGKVGSVVGFSSAWFLASVSSVDGASLGPRLVEHAVSILPLALSSPELLERLRENLAFLSAGRPSPKVRWSPKAASLRTAAIAHAFCEISQMFKQTASSRIPGETEGKAGYAADASLLRQVTEKICAECSGLSKCWEEEFGDTFEVFTGLIRECQMTGRLTGRGENAQIAKNCHRFPEVVAALNHECEILRLERRLHAVNRETKECLAFQYDILGHILSRAANPAFDAAAKSEALPEGKRGRRSKKSCLRVSVKAVTIPAKGSSCSGDMWMKYDLSPGRSLLILVDGMGKGDSAAKQSKETIDVLKALLDCGLDYDACISFLNSALFLSCRPDGFIAVDSLLIDDHTERAFFHKLGAPPSFIKKGDGSVLIVRGSRPPAGVVSMAPCLATSEPVVAGDEIYLVSDGVFRSSPIPARAEHMLVSKLRRLKAGSLEASVRSLSGQSRGSVDPELPDDVTVVGARIDRI